MSARDRPPAPLWRRLLWFVGLWAAGVLTVAAIGYALRAILLPGG